MRNIIHKVLSAILIAGGIGLITSAVYAGVIFVGDTENVGFKSTQKIMPAVDFTCPEGKNLYNGKCVAKCDQTTYPQATALDETKGTIASCTDVLGTYYTYTSCHNGWDLIEGDCIETDCSNFSYTSAPESIAGTVTSCKSGTKMFYKYLSCKEGWDFANGKCSVHTCSSTTYPYTTNPSSDAGTIVSCKTGAATQYGYSECRTGWDKSNGYCNIHVCDSNAFPFTSQPSSSIGTVISCKTGNDTKYGYSACAVDYDLINGQCETKCAYTSTSKPAHCAETTGSCQRNGVTYYNTTCQTCDTDYYRSNGICTPCPWEHYPYTSCPNNVYCDSLYCGGRRKYYISCTPAVGKIMYGGNACYTAAEWEATGYGSSVGQVSGATLGVIINSGYPAYVASCENHHSRAEQYQYYYCQGSDDKKGTVEMATMVHNNYTAINAGFTAINATTPDGAAYRCKLFDNQNYWTGQVNNDDTVTVYNPQTGATQNLAKTGYAVGKCYFQMYTNKSSVIYEN